MSEHGSVARRRFLAGAATAVAGLSFGTTRSLHGQSRKGTFGTLKQVDAGVLSVAYAESGPPEGPVAILLHGWPYDIHSFLDVTPLLSAAGYRVSRGER